MTTHARQIENADELLALMRESPSTRQISSLYPDDWAGEPVRIVVEKDKPEEPYWSTLAEIVPGSEAERLCEAVTRADAIPDPEAWARLPLRYHVIYSSCLLPEHPEAPQRPGGLAQAHRALDSIAADIAARTGKRSPWRWLRWPGRES
ncbi:MAG TPA: hypothetical protein VII40_05980 [Xanthobacteraceae bacterium]